jgi:hypothetical protein
MRLQGEYEEGGGYFLFALCEILDGCRVTEHEARRALVAESVKAG